jgi:hypothetical protein
MTHTNFSHAYRTYLKGHKKEKSFQSLLKGFREWLPNQSITDKQVKALATETNYTKNDKPKRNRVATNVEKKGKWYDVLTSQRMKGEYDASRVPAWRDKDVIRDRGVIINTQTGEKLKTRTQKGRFLKRSKWTLTDKSGKVTKLYPSEKKVKKVVKTTKKVKQSESVRSSKLSLRRANKLKEKGKRLRK